MKGGRIAWHFLFLNPSLDYWELCGLIKIVILISSTKYFQFPLFKRIVGKLYKQNDIFSIFYFTFKSPRSSISSIFSDFASRQISQLQKWKTMGKKPNPDKRHKSVQISISVPRELVELIDRMASSENRNRSNFIGNAWRLRQRNFQIPNRPKTERKRRGNPEYRG